MFQVSQEWKDNQAKQIRSECNVAIFISNKTEGLVATFTKKDLSSFSFEASGSFDNSILPVYRISFSILKEKIELYDFDEDYSAKIRIGYYLPNSPFADAEGWEWCSIGGNFKFASKDIPENGITATYTLKGGFDIGEDELADTDTQYIYGSNYGAKNSVIGEPFTPKLLAQYLNITADIERIDDVNSVGEGLGVVSYLEASRQLAILCGMTLSIKGGRLYFGYGYYQGVSNYDVKYINELKKPERAHTKPYHKITFDFFYNELGSANNDYIEQSHTFTADDNIVYVEAGKFLEKEIFGIRSRIIDNKIMGDASGQTLTYKLYTRKTAEYQFSRVHFDEGNKELTISTPLMSKYYAHNLKTYKLQAVSNLANTKITLNCRIDPAVELFDTISFEKQDGERGYGIVESLNYSFNGGFKGEMIIRELPFEYIPFTIVNKGNTDATIRFTNTGYLKGVCVSINGGYLEKVALENGESRSFTIPSGTSISLFRNYQDFSTSTTDYMSIYLSEGDYEFKGNITSILGDETHNFLSSNYNFYNLFNASGYLPKTIDKNFLNADTLTEHCYDSMFKNAGNIYKKNDPYTFIIPASVIPRYAFDNFCSNGNFTPPLTFDVSKATSIGYYALNVGVYVYNLLTTNSFVSFIFGTKLTTLDSTYCSSVRRLNLYFKHTNEDSVLFDTNNVFRQASDEKNSIIVNVYTDNDAIATACLNKANEYTTVNAYYYDGTNRNIEKLATPTISMYDKKSLQITPVANAEKYVIEVWQQVELHLYIKQISFETTETIVDVYARMVGNVQTGIPCDVKVRARATNYYQSEYSNVEDYFIDNVGNYYGWYNTYSPPVISWGSNNTITWSVITEGSYHVRVGDYYFDVNNPPFDTTVIDYGHNTNMEVYIMVSRNDVYTVGEYSNSLKYYISTLIGNRAVNIPAPTISFNNATKILTITPPAGYEGLLVYLIIINTAGQMSYITTSNTTYDLTNDLNFGSTINVRGYLTNDGTNCITELSNTIW